MRTAARTRHPSAGRRGHDRAIAALYTGTSGFSYSSWKGVFYPRSLSGSRMLEYYSNRLGGVELNGSFYRTPPENALNTWRQSTPANFRFCMKAARGLTYSAEGFDRVGLAGIFSGRLAQLGDKLGPILLQFPPVRRRDAALLDALLAALARRVAVEFRHESWFDESTYAVLKAHGAALVVTDEEKWPQAPLLALGPAAYFRLRRGYNARSLAPWIRTIGSALDAHQEVHVYFKHDPQAPRLAIRLRDALSAGASGSRSPR